MTLRRNIGWTIPAILLVGLAVGTWGYSQYTARRQYEVEAENQYARAFQELSYYMDGIETLSAKALVSNSRMQRAKTFSDIWRNAFAARAELGQLPLANVPLKRTQQFLSQLQTYTYSLAMKTLDENSKVNEKEWRNLQRMHAQSRVISRSLSRMGTNFTPAEFRWSRFGRDMTAAVVGGAGGPAADMGKMGKNPVVKSFVMMEDGLSRLPNPESTGQPVNFNPKPKFIEGQKITARDALRIARGFLGPQLMKGRRLTYQGRNTGDIPTFSLKAVATRRNSRKAPIYLDVTQKGGHVMWMLNQRAVQKTVYGMDRTKDLGLRFLEARNLQVIPVASQTFENIAVHSYAATYGGYVIYPELIKIQIARDNGEILGVDSVPYLTFHDPYRRVAQPSFDQNQAQTRVDKHLRISVARKAVIMNDRYQEVPCYEFDGVLGKERFRVYINIHNLDEEKVERGSDAGYEAL